MNPVDQNMTIIRVKNKAEVTELQNYRVDTESYHPNRGCEDLNR